MNKCILCKKRRNKIEKYCLDCLIVKKIIEVELGFLKKFAENHNIKVNFTVKYED